MLCPKVLSYAFSGHRGTGRTTLYKKCRSDLPKLFPESKFAFLGSPLGELPVPLLAGLDLKLHPTTILLDCWRRLNETTITQVRPALLRNEIVVTDGFGLDALLYATACNGCESSAYKETEQLHHHMVRARLHALNVPAPHYFVATAPAKIAAVRLQEAVPATTKLTPQAVDDFIEHERKTIEDYFNPGTGQSGTFLDVGISTTALFENIVQRVGADISLMARAA